MGCLDDTLRLEAAETSPLQGETPFASATRPTASGLQWLAVPSSKAGWAFRIVGGTSLERLAISETVSISATASIHAPATNICTSFDGRLVAVICIDGSMEGFDATSSGLESRWIVPNCHSHITNDLSTPPSEDRSRAASASGPVRSFGFAPSSYELLLVDALTGSLAIYNAANSEPSNELTQNVPSDVLSAAWSSAGDLPVLAVGNEDGSIEISRYQQNSLESLNKMECPNQEEEGFCCTHLDWSNEYLLVGLCKVEASDEEPDEDDEDDAAEHEAAMYMTSMDMASFSPGEWHELGDVVPFFGVPRGGRHVFFSSFAHSAKYPLCVVASNVASVAILAEEDGSWAIVEFEEGTEPTTPTDDEDEFSFPIGVGVVPLSSGFFQLLLPATDGSLSTFTFQKEDDPEAVRVATAFTAGLGDAAVEMIESSSSPPELTEEPPVPEPAGEAATEAAPAPPSSQFSLGGSSDSSAFTFGSNNATESKPAFGTGNSTPSFGAGYGSVFSFAPAKIPSSSISEDKPLFGSTSAKPTFGSTSTFGSGFGQTSTLGGFGQTSTLGAGGSTGSSIFGQTKATSSFGAPKTPEASAAPAFGATTSSSGPVFGSGSKAGTSGGFAALSSSSSSTGFGATFSPQKKSSYSDSSVFEKKAETETSTPQADAPSEPQTPSTPAPSTGEIPKISDATIFGSGSKAPAFTFGTPSANPFALNTTTPAPAAESPFNAFGSSKFSPSHGGFVAKPLFGTTKEEEKVTVPETPCTPKESPPAHSTDDILSDVGKAAARVFDTFDEEKIGSLPIDSFENLSEELGEGFHGDEYDKQIAIIDPTGSGSISRDAFINWYTDLVEGVGDDASSIDSDERAEREEERQNALQAFQNISGGNDTIPETDFPKLIESLNTVYCEEEHRKTLKIIARGGEIHQLDFLSWYVGWLFGGDESSDEEEVEENEASIEATEASSKSKSLGAIFAVDKDSWKCEMCSVRNTDDAKKCVACGAVRPGFEDDVAKEGQKAADSSGSAIGSGGFSFGGSSSSGGIGSGGFTFGAQASAAAESTTASSGGGFTFGAPAPASTGFTFGAPKADTTKPVTESGFTFGGPAARIAATTPKSEEASTGFSFTPPKATALTKPITSDQALSAAGKSAARVFDTSDDEKMGSLPIESFENLSEELGAGFSGDEYDKQIAIIDPSGSGKITRAAFIDWYTELVEGGDNDGSSIDSEERAEREEERQKAKAAFQNLSANKSTIPSSDFPKLIEGLDTVYCEEEHRKTIKKISKDGKIHESDFLSWYVDWLFGGDESSDDDDDDDDDRTSAAAKGESSKSESLGAIFAVDKDSWKCEMCSVRNTDDAKKCVACGAVRAGFEDDVAKEGQKAVDSSGSANGSGGFSFGGSSSNGGIGSGGFTFGAPAPAGGPAATNSGGGFTFGAPAPASTGFTFASTQTDGTSAAPSASTASKAFASGATPAAGEKVAAGTVGEMSKKANKLASSGGYPPIASKAPTPFSAQTSSTSGAMKPKDEPAKPANPFSGISLVPSKPFGSSTTKATASTSPAALPTKAPTPFGTKTSIATGTKGEKLANPFAGISLVPSKPVDDSSKKIVTSGGTAFASAALPPLSTKAPTPFSASATPTKATKSGSSAAFPPMSTRAPTPFSAQTAPNTVSSTKPKSGSSAAFPPMSAKAPTPFSAQTSPVGVSSTKSKSGSSAAFPPMSAKAPTPFSAQTAPATVSSTKSKSGSSAAFPPMSTKAPTPFSAQTSSTGMSSTKSNSGSSAAFPPMSTKAPTPFSAKTASTSMALTKATTPASSAAFPPMSSKAPTPFGASTKTDTSQSPFSVAPKATPSIFGSSTKAAKATSSAAFPPMSSKAPTPFSASTISSKSQSPFSVAPKVTPSILGSSSAEAAAFPPMSSKAPTPFGGGQVKQSSKARTPLSATSLSTSSTTPSGVQSTQLVARASSSKAQDRLGVSNLRSKLSRKMPATGIRFLEMTEKMERVLKSVGRLHVSTEMDEDFEDKVQSMVDRVQNHRISLAAIGTSIGRQRQTNTFLLSRKVDSERQIKEAKRLVDIIATESGGGKGKIAETQPLDYESEMKRRKFAATSIGVVGIMKLADEKLNLLEAASQAADLGSQKLAEGVVEQFKRTDAFQHRLDRIDGKLDKASQSLPLQEKQRIEKSRTGQSTYGLTTTPRKQRPRPVPLDGTLTPLSKLAASRKQDASSARKWSRISSSLQSTGNKYSRTIRVGGTSRLKNLRRSEEEKPSFKSPSVARSLLLSPSQEKPFVALPQSSNVPSTTSITIFSPKTKTKARAGWDSVSTLDQAKARKLSFSVPGELKESTLTDASRHQLERFGTTPEKVKRSIDIKKSQSAVSTPTRPQEQVPKENPMALSAKKGVPSAAFPPMSTKAPTNPFSKTSQKSTDSKPPMKPKQETIYPPMSAVAPKPFSSMADSKSTSVPKKETPPTPSKTPDKSAKKSDPFSTASMGSSLFSSGNGSGSTPSPFGAQPSSESANKNSDAPDYNTILVSFYQKHNPAKVAEVGKTLEKYKGREVEMFQKLAAKYKVKSPLDEIQNKPSTAPPAAAGGMFGGAAAPAQSPFSSAVAPASNTSASPFQSSGPSNALNSASPFSSGAAMNTGSTFGKPPASPFGPAPGTSNMGSSAPFGSPAAASTPFGSGGLSSASPFGGAPSPSPFGGTAAPAPAMQTGATQNSLQGKDPRQMLMQFYQQYNPSKLGEVDKVLTKYKGKEEQLFRNLAKKYNLDASAFGLPPAPAASGFGSPAPGPTAFGQASTLGGTSTFGGSGGFGQTSQMGFGSTSNTGSGTAFGSGMSSAQGTSSFGSLAQAPSPSPFGSAPAMGGGFGSPAPGFGATSSMGFGSNTPFGAPRR